MTLIGILIISSIVITDVPTLEIAAVPVNTVDQIAVSKAANPSAASDSFANRSALRASTAKVVGYLAVIIGALFAVSTLFIKQRGKFKRFDSGRLIRVVETLRLGGRQTVYLLRIGSEYKLVGSSEHGLSMLSDGTLNCDAFEASVDSIDPSMPADGRHDHNQSTVEENNIPAGFMKILRRHR